MLGAEHVYGAAHVFEVGRLMPKAKLRPLARWPNGWTLWGRMVGDCVVCKAPAGFTNPENQPQHPGCRDPDDPPADTTDWYVPPGLSRRDGIRFDPKTFPPLKGGK